MDPSDNHYHFVLIIIVISLIIAAGISVLFTAGPGPEQSSNTSLLPHISDSSGQDLSSADSWIVRILWVDHQNRTYSFQDYPQETRPDPDVYTFQGDPPPGAEAAMIRFLSWDGSTERTQGARYIIDGDGNICPEPIQPDGFPVSSAGCHPSRYPDSCSIRDTGSGDADS